MATYIVGKKTNDRTDPDGVTHELCERYGHAGLDAEFEHTLIDISKLSHGPSSRSLDCVKSGPYGYVLEDLIMLVQAMAEDAVDTVNDAQVLRLIRATRSGC